MYLTASQKAILNALCPAMPTLGDVIDTLGSATLTGNLGITALAADVDAVCKDTGAFAQDLDTTSGLTLGYQDGRVVWGQTVVDYPAGTILLSGSATNYVEATAGGTIVKNTTAFTAGNFPLFSITTSSGAITAITRKRPLLSMVASSGITGALLSANARTVRTQINVGTLSATGTVRIVSPPYACVRTALRIVVDTTIVANDTDYWDAAEVNKTSSGTGTTAMLSSADSNTTKATGGSGITGYVARDLTLHGTPANLVCAANDVSVLTLTKHGSAANLVNLQVVVEWTFAG